MGWRAADGRTPPAAVCLPLVSRGGYYTLFASCVQEVQTLIMAVWAVWHSGRADVLIPQE